MKAFKIEDGEVEVTLEESSGGDYLHMKISDGGNSYFKPEQAIEVGQAMIDEGRAVMRKLTREPCNHLDPDHISYADDRRDGAEFFWIKCDCGKGWNEELPEWVRSAYAACVNQENEHVIIELERKIEDLKRHVTICQTRNTEEVERRREAEAIVGKLKRMLGVCP